MDGSTTNEIELLLHTRLLLVAETEKLTEKLEKVHRKKAAVTAHMLVAESTLKKYSAALAFAGTSAPVVAAPLTFKEIEGLSTMNISATSDAVALKTMESRCLSAVAALKSGSVAYKPAKGVDSRSIRSPVDAERTLGPLRHELATLQHEYESLRRFMERPRAAPGPGATHAGGAGR